MNDKITKEYLRKHPDHIFVFGDNFQRMGYGGAASLRDEPNTYGFITKKYPDYDNGSYYTVDEYKLTYITEIIRLKYEIKKKTDKIFLISKLGAGLANKYHIFEKIIEPNIKKDLLEFKNVRFLW